MPALFTRISTRPWRLRIACAARDTSFWSATSSAIASPLPTALISFSAFLRVSALRPEITTWAPARASSMPPASPIPEPPPVIQTTLPLGILSFAEQILPLLVGHGGAAPVGEHLHRALHRRALEDRVAPALERRVLVDVHALALGRAQPRHDRHVGNRVLVARHVFAFAQSLVHNPVEAIRFAPVAVHRVLDLLRRVAEEVVRLAEHRPDVAHLEHGPLHHLPALAQVLGQEAAGLRREVEQHRARLGERERLAVRAVGVDHRRHLVVRRDLEEIRLELVADADVDRDHAVRRAGLLEHDVDLVAVGRRPRVEINHGAHSSELMTMVRAILSCQPCRRRSTAAHRKPRYSGNAETRYPRNRTTSCSRLGAPPVRASTILTPSAILPGLAPQ